MNLQEADDMRFYQSSGPFELGPGESAEIVVAYIAGAPVPGTYNMGTRLPVGEVTDTTRAIEAVMGRGYDVPGFPSLFANSRTARAAASSRRSRSHVEDGSRHAFMCEPFHSLVHHEIVSDDGISFICIQIELRMPW